MARTRKIIHIDMDAFFAAVEQRDFPEYRGKPLVVGGTPDGRGVVSTCSYEARRFGIRSAMPAAHARRLCPEAIFVRPRFEAYRQVSMQIREIFLDYTDLVEPLSLDEAYLDVSDCNIHHGSATLIAREIKQRILTRTDLTASAGISYNKFLAKIASDLDKPDGLTVITPSQGTMFAEGLPVGQFHGIGRATEAKMHRLGIRTGRDLKAFSLESLQRHFGKAGRHYYQIARGVDDRPVVAKRPSKSLGAETTFPEDLADLEAMRTRLFSLMKKVMEKLTEKRLEARTVTLKVKYADFELVTRSRTVTHPLTDSRRNCRILDELLGRTEAGRRKVRLLGVTFSSLSPADTRPQKRQLDLFAQDVSIDPG